MSIAPTSPRIAPTAESAAPSVEAPPAVARSYRCQCGLPVFFRNSRCLNCATELGYLPDAHAMIALEPAGEPGEWKPHQEAAGLSQRQRSMVMKRCANFEGPAGCNWLVPIGSGAAEPMPWCRSCRLNRTIPDLTNPEYAAQWAQIEVAKRRLVSSLLAIGLPVRSKVHEDPEHGVMFDFLHGEKNEPVMTGHDEGLITLNIEEADDAKREKLRQAMHEPYRTLLGHLRHEIGHYYWDVLVDGTGMLATYRELFGDETLDYSEALDRHYQQGAPTDWADHYVSAYATMHPWEDWAETWAHYLHMIDTLDTALSFGLSAANVELEMEPFGRDALYAPNAADAEQFLAIVNDWARLTGVLNEMSRSMGQPDFYPFVLPRDVVGKLQFIHAVVQHAAGTTKS